MDFKKYVVKYRKCTPPKNNVFGDIGFEIKRDKTFPKTYSWDVVEAHLIANKTSRDGISSARAVFEDYQAALAKLDKISEKDLKRIRTALRNVWRYSFSRRLCELKADIGEGYSRCQLCGFIVPKVYVDHIEPVGTIDARIIERLFVPSTKMQALCKKCHGEKTKRDNKKIKDGKDFY